MKRAIADLHKVSADSLAFGEAIALKLEARVRDVISHIAPLNDAKQPAELSSRRPSWTS